MEDNVIVASCLVLGLTELDLLYARTMLEKYKSVYAAAGVQEHDMKVEFLADESYPCLMLAVNRGVWENFSKEHDLAECSLLLSQHGILGGVH